MSDLFASECSGESRHHRHPAHPPPVDINQRPTILHVNVCTKDRERSLDNANAMAALKASWVKSTQWIVGYFMIMPDHIHLFCAPGCHDPEPVRRWCGYWKRLVGAEMPTLKGGFQEDCWTHKCAPWNIMSANCNMLRAILFVWAW